ncbi:MAG: hypothetical protein HZA91_02265 [Verrucomicrobia bacterium]|nr:hypothetical protein [Verrucomicrobiota bacterium]
MPVLALAAIIIAAAAAFFYYDHAQTARQEELRVSLRKEFTADLVVALEKALKPLNDQLGLLQPDSGLPAVSLLSHNNLIPKGTGQIEIFNLASTAAYADSSGTRVTGEIYNGTPRQFGLLSIALVALDAHGKVLRRQPVIFTGIPPADRRAFDVTLPIPMSNFAAHRFEIDAAH